MCVRRTGYGRPVELGGGVVDDALEGALCLLQLQGELLHDPVLLGHLVLEPRQPLLLSLVLPHLSFAKAMQRNGNAFNRSIEHVRGIVDEKMEMSRMVNGAGRRTLVEGSEEGLVGAQEALHELFG